MPGLSRISNCRGGGGGGGASPDSSARANLRGAITSRVTYRYVMRRIEISSYDRFASRERDGGSGRGTARVLFQCQRGDRETCRWGVPARFSITLMRWWISLPEWHIFRLWDMGILGWCFGRLKRVLGNWGFEEGGLGWVSWKWGNWVFVKYVCPSSRIFWTSVMSFYFISEEVFCDMRWCDLFGTGSECGRFDYEFLFLWRKILQKGQF